jgi:MFS family permease/S1-C subfamily serine protease
VRAVTTAEPRADGRAALGRLAAGLAAAVAGNVGMWSVVVILPAVQAEFATQRGDASLPYTATMLGFALGNLLVGRAVDRHGIAPVLALSALASGAGHASAALAPTIAMLALAQFVIGLGTAAFFGPLIADVSHWFARRRGLAVALVACGNYLAGAIWPLLLADVLREDGWRASCLVLAVAVPAIVLPLTLTMRRRAPEAFYAAATAAAAARAGRTAIPSRVLVWMLSAAGVACCVAMSMPQVHIVALCADLGYGPAVGAEMLAVMLMGGMVSRIVWGLVTDRLGGVATLLIGSALQGLALVLYLFADGLTPLHVVSLIFGLSQGGIVPAYAVIVREYLPAREAGARVGLVMMATILGMALGGWMSGAIHDLTGSYAMAFANGIAWNVLNLVLVGALIWRGGGMHPPARIAASVLLCAALLATAAPQPARAQIPDPARLSADERRFLQGALAWEGSYLGLLDGQWGGRSAAALAATTARLGGPEGLAAAVRHFAARLEAEGWTVLGEEGPSFLVPLRRLEAERSAETHVTLRAPDNALIVRFIVDDVRGTVAMHDWLASNHAGRDPFYRSVTAGRWISAGRLANGRLVYLWSVPRDGILLTLTVQADPREAAGYRLIVASLRDGPQRPLALPRGGELARWLHGDRGRGSATATPPAREPEASGSGTGFFVAPDILVTAQHVVDGCRAVRMADGTALFPLRSDAANDLALLRAARPTATWLSLSSRSGRLAETVYALGYPYGDLLSRRLTVTSGTLSALPSPADRVPQMMISAPVQPGSSGGPVLGADGGVIGVVVSRLDDLRTLEATGSLPQNVNFAVPLAVLRDLLSAAGIVPPRGPLEGMAPTSGLPDTIGAAVVPVQCLG